MNADHERLRALLGGEDPTRTSIAVGLAGLFFVGGATLDYYATSHLTSGVRSLWLELWQAFFLLDPLIEPVPLLWLRGYVIVGGLAAIHTYFNCGCLTSVLLALSPRAGMGLWSPRAVTSPNYYEYVTFTPMNVFDVSPRAVLLALLGVIVGLELRKRKETPATSPENHHSHE